MTDPSRPDESDRHHVAGDETDAVEFRTKYKRDFLWALVILAVAAFLVYLQTNLPFFKKYLPVGDNKLLIALLNLNLLLILALIFLVTRILLKTYIEKRRGIWGSGLKTKLTVTVFAISIVSSFTLFILMAAFFDISIDKWFGDKVGDTIDSARDLSVFYYEDLFGRYDKMAQGLVATIEEEKALDNPKRLAVFINRQGKANFLGYLSVVDNQGQPIRTYSTLDEQTKSVIARESYPFIYKKQGRQIVTLKDGELLLFTAPIHDASGQLCAYLLMGQKIRVQGTKSITQISLMYREFKAGRSFKKILKWSFTIPLFLVTILTIFCSIWLGRKMATEIAIPLERVKEGAAIIAGGRFDINLEDRGKDEIGTLVSAFNRMAKELKTAKDEIEERRKYMEVILDNVSTGIISTDAKGSILLFNRAARDILKLEDGVWLGTPLRNVLGDDFRKIIRPFLREIRRETAENVVIQETMLSLHNNNLNLRASLTVLRNEAKKIEGYIITFDDITHIVKAEKLATWREIAKRLTHEIKNPLTPIKLSAERLRRRVLPKSEGRERQVLEEATSVILSSSEDITQMVNELTKLTHASAKRTMEDMNAVVEETINIYRSLYTNIVFTFERAGVPRLRIDRDAVKRAIINLVTNSIKAIGSAQGTITVSLGYERHRGAMRIEVADTGPGINDGDKSRIFEPYFTRNHGGMGLGLTIVHSIVLEHNGKIHVEDNVPTGARFVIELPLFEA